jgi:hypothetical protein
MQGYGIGLRKQLKQIFHFNFTEINKMKESQFVALFLSIYFWELFMKK